MQVYSFCHPADSLRLQQQMSACIDDLAAWMRSNRLQLNTAKTEIMWASSSRQQGQLPANTLRVGNDFVMPTSSVHDLVIWLHSDLFMKTHVKKTAAGCFAMLRQIQSIRRSVSQDVLQSLVTSLVLWRLDYSNATFAGVTATLLTSLQAISGFNLDPDLVQKFLKDYTILAKNSKNIIPC